MMMYISKNNEKNLNYFNFLDVVAEASLLNYIVQESLLKEAALTVPASWSSGLMRSSLKREV